MLFCIQGEEHSIGMKMISSIFKENGYDTRYLGANLSMKNSVVYANIWRPDVIGISLSIIYNLPTLLECLKELNQLEIEKSYQTLPFPFFVVDQDFTIIGVSEETQLQFPNAMNFLELVDLGSRKKAKRFLIPVFSKTKVDLCKGEETI